MSKPICVFQSPAWTRSGYGDLGLAIAKSLLRYDKFDLKIVPTKWGGCSKKYLAEDITDPVEKELFNKILREPLTKQPEVFIHCTIPNEFQTPAKYNIGITAGIETTVAKPEWIEGLNKMNFNFVTSKHAKDVFESATYTLPNQIQGAPSVQLKSLKPIEVLFWGANTNVYKKTDVIESSVETELSKIKEDFCFLFVGQWTNSGLFGDRKDIGNLIRAFLETFSNFGVKPKPALIIKTSGAAICNMDKHDMILRLKTVRELVSKQLKTSDLPNVYLLHGELSDVEMNSLFNHEKVRANISFTHGEGYGMPLLEATLSGKPVLAPGWSGHIDFLNPEYAEYLKYEVKPIQPESINEWLIKDSSWAYVDYVYAAEKMKHCFYNYTSYLYKAEKLRLENMEKFSELAMDKKFHALLDKYIPDFPVEKPLVLPKLKKITPKTI